jgi:hypothetical protein
MSLRSVAFLSEAGGKTLFQASSMEISNRPFAQGSSLMDAKNSRAEGGAACETSFAFSCIRIFLPGCIPPFPFQ